MFSHDRIGTTAAVRQAWSADLGLDGGFVGMTGLGASGPAHELQQLLNICPEAGGAVAQRLLKI